MSYAHLPLAETCFESMHEAARYEAWAARRPHSVITPGTGFWTWGFDVADIGRLVRALEAGYTVGLDSPPGPYPWLPSYGVRDLVRVVNSVGYPSTVWFVRGHIETAVVVDPRQIFKAWNRAWVEE